MSETSDFVPVGATFDIHLPSPVEIELGADIDVASVYFRMRGVSEAGSGWHVMANHGAAVRAVHAPSDFSVLPVRGASFVARWSAQIGQSCVVQVTVDTTHSTSCEQRH